MNQQAQWTAEIVVNAPLRTVWEVANDVTLIPRYHPDVDTVNVNGNARYVRIQGVTRGTAYGYSLYELGVYA